MEAWTLVEWIGEAITTWLSVKVSTSFLKGVLGAFMNNTCLIKSCHRMAACDKRGLCLVCYGQAKKKVDNKQTTWDQLEKMGLCKSEDSPFNSAYDKAVEDN